MVNFATRYGVEAETCLLGTDITAAQLRDADALISREQATERMRDQDRRLRLGINQRRELLHSV